MAEKEKKPLADKYTLMKTEDLLKDFEGWHADTEEAAQKRQEAANRLVKNLKKIEKGELKYFLGNTNKESLEDLTEGDLKFKPTESKKQASELLNSLLVESMKHEYGEEAAKLYSKNPEMLAGYAATKGINWYEVRDDLKEHHLNPVASKKYQQVKQILAQDLDKEGQHIRKVESELARDKTHHAELRKRANKAFQKHGYTIDDTVEGEHVIGHFKNVLSGGINKDYLHANQTHFKKYKAN